MIYKALILRAGESWNAYVPDLPCFAVSSSRRDVEKLIRESVVVYIEYLRDHGEPVPPPTTAEGTIDVEAA